MLSDLRRFLCRACVASRVTVSTCVLRYVPALAFMLAVTGRAAEYFPPADSEGGWRMLKEPTQVRELARLDPVRLEQAFNLTERSTQNGGLLVSANRTACLPNAELS